MRQYRAKHAGREAERARTDPVVAKKVQARIAARALRNEPKPCESCGATEAAKRHDDYDQPLVVRWLCAKCHGAERYPEAQVEPDEREAALVSAFNRLAEKYASR